MLTEIGPELWAVRSPLKFLGLEMGTQMTVARADGALWVCSPIALGDELRASLDALGPVRWVVAPNRFHHLFVPDFAAAYPEAQLWCCPGLRDKRSDVAWHGDAGRDDGGWPDAIDSRGDLGIPMIDEVVFFHRPSRSLICADLVMNWRPTGRLAPDLVMKLDGVSGQPGFSRAFRLLVRDKARLRAGVEHMLAWDPDRILVTHGLNIDVGGREALNQAFDWLT